MSLTSAAGKATGSLRQLKTQADTAATAAQSVGRAATSGQSGLDKLRSAAQSSARELKTLQQNADSAEKSVARAGKAGQTGGTQIGKFKGGADNAAKGMNGLNTSMKGNIIARLLELFAPLIEKVVSMAAQSKTMQKVLKTAFDAVKAVISSVMKAVGPIMKSAGDLIKKVWDGIKKAISVVVQAVGKVISTYFNAWKKVITTVMNAVKSVISSVWKGIKGVITPVVNWVRNDIPKAFTLVKDKLSSIWGGLKGIASKAFDAVKNAVRTPLNSVIDLINSAIGKLNGIRVSIPGWVPGVGGKSFGISLPRIPRLAEGGVVTPRTGGVPAILAEAGEAEAVLPLSKLDRLLRHTAARARTGTALAPAGAGFHIEHYHAAPSSDARDTAKALMFLAKARG
ncbi:phage tail protein [Streptomyces yaizuensis]|uniref:Phage tail protein n=1 Tax=Streptomyces yaizuensis TaxID=2989713 RepID=A0ABQ5P4P1_9ACTN|nr:phage tail protein [Streptomyces sp. YSPA8]GLF97544.1 phage tail protein [Streptomyces sp. YSPA8]